MRISYTLFGIEFDDVQLNIHRNASSIDVNQTNSEL